MADFNDTFNRADSGTVGNSWNETGTAEIKDNTCLLTTATSAIDKTITATSITRLDLKIKTSDTGVSDNNSIEITSGGTAVATISFSGDTIKEFSSAAWNSITGVTIADDTFFVFSMRNINYTSDTYDVWVDGVEKETGLPFRNDVADIDKLKIISRATTLNIDFITDTDDITISPSAFALSLTSQAPSYFIDITQGALALTLSLLSPILENSMNPNRGGRGTKDIRTSFPVDREDGKILSLIPRTVNIIKKDRIGLDA